MPMHSGFGMMGEAPGSRKRSRTPERSRPSFDDALFRSDPEDNVLAPFAASSGGTGYAPTAPAAGQGLPSPFVPPHDKRQPFLAAVLPTRLPPTWNAELYEDYRTSLQDDLVSTSTQKKFVIANLTTIAKENKAHHLEVFSAIVVRLTEAEDNNKLDIWCLVDNVCKRVGGRYIQTVEAQLPLLLAYEMPRADPKLREKFAKLIETWHKVFPQTMGDILAHFNAANLQHGRDAPPWKQARVS